MKSWQDSGFRTWKDAKTRLWYFNYSDSLLQGDRLRTVTIHLFHRAFQYTHWNWGWDRVLYDRNKR